MSLSACEIERESGEYKDFKFTVKVLYQRKSTMKGLKPEVIGGVVYIQDKQNRIEEVELLIEDGKIKNVETLKLAATKMGFEISNLDGLTTEILRKYRLVDILKNPQEYSGRFLTSMTIEGMLRKFPELTQPSYVQRLPQDIRERIENFLVRKGENQKIFKANLYI